MRNECQELRKQVGNMHQLCKESRAALEETRSFLETTRTKQREHAMLVGSLLDDQRAVADAQAGMEQLQMRIEDIEMLSREA